MLSSNSLRELKNTPVIIKEVRKKWNISTFITGRQSYWIITFLGEHF
jgi:hypothetical protein